MDLGNSTTCDDAKTLLQGESDNLHKIERFVITTIFFFAIVFLLSGLKKRFAKQWVKLISSLCYMTVPMLISYTLGLMGQTAQAQEASDYFNKWYANWAVFLLFTYNGRSKFVFQFLGQVALVIVLLKSNYRLVPVNVFVPVGVVFFVVCLKFVERLAALGHAAGATHGIRENLSHIMAFGNKAETEAEAGADSWSMYGFKYLVGPKYATTKNGEIVDGITVEKIWGCGGRLLSSESRGGDLEKFFSEYPSFENILRE